MLGVVVAMSVSAAPASVEALQAEVSRLQGELAACRGASSVAPAPTAQPSKLGEEERAAFRFKELTWGMPVAAVQKLRPVASLQKTGELVMQEHVADLKAGVVLKFVEGGLAEVVVLFDDVHSDPSGYWDEFRRVSRLLTEKYGAPANEMPYWKNELYKSEPAKWGLAIAAGQYVHQTSWELPDTKIRLTISGDNFEVQMRLGYVASRYAEALKKARAQQRLEGL